MTRLEVFGCIGLVYASTILLFWVTAAEIDRIKARLKSLEDMSKDETH